ncbi:hypothetical protein [Kangiella sp.]|uniref:hypothetical protein n=1 Tax=Kangiella sp. TaxID=1920245 RepID=UPI003A933A3C
MSNDIDKKLWRIQEQAMDKAVASEYSDLEELREYQSLYELLEQQPEEQPSPLLVERITKHISQRHCKQQTSKLLTYLLCSLIAAAMIVGLIMLLPQSALLNKLSQSIPLPLILSALFASGLSGFILRRLIERNISPQ